MALGAILFAQSAFAQAMDYGRPGMYGAIHLVYGIETFDDVPDFDNSVGVGGRFGYRFDPHFAAEGLIEYSGEFERGGLDVTSTLFVGQGKYYILTDQFQPYVLAGVGFGNADTNVSGDDNSFVFRFGGGMDFYLTRNIGLLGELVYNVTTGDQDDLRYLSLGFGAFYRF
jgi:opacity protein-like surface antigen